MYKIYVVHKRVLQAALGHYKELRALGVSPRNSRHLAHVMLIAEGDHPYSYNACEYAARGGETYVTIENCDGQTVADGWAFCSWEDSYCKRTGIKIALKRAIVSSNLAYEEWMPLAVTYGTDYVVEVRRAFVEALCSMPF